MNHRPSSWQQACRSAWAILLGVLVCVAVPGIAGGAGPQPAYAHVTGSPFSTNYPAGAEPFSVAIDPGGDFLATANNVTDNVSIFGIAADGTLTPVAGSPFSTHGPSGGGGLPYSVAFSPGGGLLATANSDEGDVSVFQVAADGRLSPAGGSPFSTTRPHGSNAGPNAVAFSPDGTLLATANPNDDSVSVFEVEADGRLGPPLGPFSTDNGPTAPGGFPFSVAFSPDGRLLATANLFTDNVSVFEVAPDGTLHQVSGSPFATTRSGGGSGPQSVAFSPTGGLLATANQSDVSLFDVASDGALSQVAHSPFSVAGPSSVAFSPGGGLLATANFGGAANSTVSVYEVTNNATLVPVPGSPFDTSSPAGDGEGPVAAVFGRGGRLLATANYSANSVSVFFPTGGLVVGKVAPAVVRPGGVVSYVVSVRNPGVDPAMGPVSDDLSAVLRLASYSGDARASSGSVVFDGANHTLTWNGVLAGGATATITYSVRVRAGVLGGLLSNGVTGPPGSTCAGPTPVVPCVAVTRIEPAPAPGPDLVLTKTASAQSVHPGGQLVYTLVVRNRGPGVARGVRLLDPGPSGLFLQRAASSQGSCTISGGLRCRLGDIRSGGSVTVSLTATVAADASGTIVNLATVDDAQHDSRPPNNTATATVVVRPLPGPPAPDPGPQPVSDLSIAKRASRARVVVGGRLSYTITVTNNGPQPGADVRVTDSARLPMRLLSVHASQGRCQPGTPIQCRLGTLARGARATVRVTAVPTVTGTQVNAATVTSGSWDTTSAILALARTAIHTIRNHHPQPPPFTG
jgi:uncharacterized repeat protein (TIGR01451 family)